MICFRTLVGAMTLGATVALAAGPERKEVKEQALTKKESNIAPDKSLAGDITRVKAKRDEGPTFRFDQFRTAIEGQVASKRREQITDLKKIISLSNDQKERPGLLFRLGELYWEESKFFFFEANRKDDDKIAAMQKEDKAGVERAESEKTDLMAKSKENSTIAVENYSRIIQEFKDFERTDEVLYFLGLNLMEMGEEKKAVVAYNRLIEKFPKSKFLPDAYLARADYFFNGSKGKREQIEKALEDYKNAAKYPENAVYGYALYKQGWCYFNLSEYEKAMDQFKAVVLYADIAGVEAVEGAKGKNGKAGRAGLAKEARNDYVRAYSRAGGGPTEAKDRFSKLAKQPEDLRTMMKQLAGLFYEDGKDKEAAVAYDMLIKERPISPEAPGFQAKIIDCVMRAGKKQQTVQQIRRLVTLTNDVTAKNKTLDDKSKKALDEARELSERTISNLAVNWHNEAKKTRDEETFGYANEVYADYLTLFPDNAKAYDLRFYWAELLNDNLGKFEKAAEEYTKVSLIDVGRITKGQKPGKWLQNSTYNSVYAWGEVVKKAEADGRIKAPDTKDVAKKAAIPPEKKSLIEACDRYVKYVENGEKRVDLAYKAARIYYDHNWFDESTARMSEIATKYPDYKSEDGSRVGEAAANNVLDTYNLLQDWGKLNEAARKFYADDRLAEGKFKEELAKQVEQSSFKLINELEGKKDFGKAAETYMNFVNEFPRSELADKALYNASIDYFKAKQLDKAIDVRKQIIQKYPKSKFVPETMYALAEGYEAVTDFENAASYYEAYANSYAKSIGAAPIKKSKAAKGKVAKGKKEEPKTDDSGQQWTESKAQDALINAGIFREGLGAYPQALTDRTRYLEMWPDGESADAVSKSLIDLYEKMGQYKKAIDRAEEYGKSNVKNPSKALWAEGRIAGLYGDRMKNQRNARGVYKRALETYQKKMGKTQRDGLDNPALDVIGKASLIDNEEEERKFNSIKLKWTRAQNLGELKGSIQKKGLALAELKKAYTRTVTYKSGEAGVCALNKLGLALDSFATAVDNISIPRDVPAEVVPQLKDGFAEQARPIRDQAAEAFAAAVEKSREVDLFNACSASALELLRTKYRPEQFPPVSEDIMAMKMEASKQMAIGQDVLTSIQSVQSVSPEKAAEMKAKAQNVGRDVAEVSQVPVAKEKAAPAAKGAKEAPPDSKPKKKSGDEPEEPL